jgi:hypothetical protein
MLIAFDSLKGLVDLFGKDHEFFIIFYYLAIFVLSHFMGMFFFLKMHKSLDFDDK